MADTTPTSVDPIQSLDTPPADAPAPQSAAEAVAAAPLSGPDRVAEPSPESVAGEAPASDAPGAADKAAGSEPAPVEPGPVENVPSVVESSGSPAPADEAAPPETAPAAGQAAPAAPYEDLRLQHVLDPQTGEKQAIHVKVLRGGRRARQQNPIPTN